jgi:carbohydrate kinase (thermoresistant glucokinase family)
MRSTRAESEPTPLHRCGKTDKISPSYKTRENPIRPAATIADVLKNRPRSVAAVVMGVSGLGKSTVGLALAERLSWEFEDGDALYPPENIAKMRAGKPLDDADRAPWLAAIAARIDDWVARGTQGIIIWSALKRRYRDAIIRCRDAIRLIYLEGSPALIGRRLVERRGHFMSASLLLSQFATLEPPNRDEGAIVVSIDQPIAAIVEHIVTALSLRQASMMVPA